MEQNSSYFICRNVNQLQTVEQTATSSWLSEVNTCSLENGMVNSMGEVVVG